MLPLITVQPVSVLVNAGETASFQVNALGLRPLSYQWQLNGTSIPVATGPMLTITNVQPINTGAYDVAVTNGFGSVTSATATLGIAVLNPKMLAGLVVDGPPGAKLRVDWSTDLNTWHFLTNLVLDSPPLRFADWDSAGQPKRFYRYVLLP